MGRWSQATNVEMVWCHQMICWFLQPDKVVPPNCNLCTTPISLFWRYLPGQPELLKLFQHTSTILADSGSILTRPGSTWQPWRACCIQKHSSMPWEPGAILFFSTPAIGGGWEQPNDGLIGWNFGFLNSTWVIFVSPCGFGSKLWYQWPTDFWSWP